ncbi:MAG: hypothetical protein SAK29_37705 [Scytonema sp. PMC 1069.18]|nr:hypothetical protein [Scytonema sp. PMC 1069.18]MEC4884315.1 hypothetical protein [Scytonema sp. PMC 1070.18]
MKTILLHRNTFRWLGLSAIAVLGSSIPAVAQTTDITTTQQFITSVGDENSVSQPSVEVETFYPDAFTPTAVETSVTQENLASVPEFSQSQQLTTNIQQETTSKVVTPVPGTTLTSSTELVASQDTKTEVQQSASSVAQADISPVVPGRRTRGGSSYIGVAGNIGLGGDSALGDGNFAIISKIGLTRTFSARPSVVLGDNPVILVPLTYDFTFRQVDPFSEPLPIAPYAGLGAAIETGDNSEVGFLLTGGIDLPIAPQFTATAAVNAAFLNQTDVGLLIGVGYNFSGLFGL